MNVQKNPAQASLLVIDDTPDNLSLMSRILRHAYRVRLANSGERGLALAAEEPPDLVLLDIMMPGIDGYEVCRRLKADPDLCDVPVIFLTAMSEPEDEKKGLDLGAVDYIVKPISPPIVLARIKTHLALKASADFLRSKSDYLEAEVAKRTEEMQTFQDVTIFAMAGLAETRDNDTGNHIRRTQLYVKLLAEEARRQPRFAASLDERSITTLYKSAPLHDIGKVGIPDRILLKPGRLDAEEFANMQRHCRIGHDVIVTAERALAAGCTFLTTAKEIALWHHEKWDGSGYPDGLAGEAIPLSARLMALADVYDALISARVYKAALPHAAAVEIIVEGSGSHFDPDLVSAFRNVADQFAQIASIYADDEGGSGA